METLPLVPLRDMVVFPHMMQPFVVGRESSIRALEAALTSPVKRLFLAAQRDPQLDEPKPQDIYDVGVIATVAQSLKLPNGHIKVMVEGVRRGRIRLRAPGRVPDVAVYVVPVKPADADTSSTTWQGSRAVRQYASVAHLAFEVLASLKMTTPSIRRRSPRTWPCRRRKAGVLSGLRTRSQSSRPAGGRIDKVNIDRRSTQVKKQWRRP